MRKLKRLSTETTSPPWALQLRKVQGGNGKVLGGTPVISRVSILLDQTTAGVTENVSWVQVASQGDYRGYAGGTKSFTFDATVFNAIIGNFRRHPSYKKGPDGIGCEDIIAWDFHHASEMDPTHGSIPVEGVPAQAWIRELALRQNPTNQQFELWALTNWLEPAKSYVREGRYKWASVSVVFDAIDARTAANIGPILTSVALTNQPFIEGMQKLAAERWRKGMYIECADSAEDALEMIRSMLALPGTADAATVMAELDKVKTWLATGSTPVGVELDDIVGDLRTILNLPALSSADEVFVEVAKLVTRLGTETGVDGGQVSPSATPPAGTQVPGGQVSDPQPPASPPAIMSRLEKRTMDLIKLLASKFGVVATPEAIAEAAEQLVELRGTVIKQIGLSATAANSVLLKALVDDASVRAKYVPLLSALGVEDPNAALDKIATMMADSAKLAEITPEFSALKLKAQEEEAASEEEEVEAAVETTGVTAESEHFDGMKVALATLRKTDRKKFDEKYPQDKLKIARQAIASRKAVASGTVPQSRGADAATLTRKIVATGDQKSGAGLGEGGQIDVSQYEGANTILKTCSFVRASVAGAKDWTWDRVHEHATSLVRKKAVAG